MTLEDNDYFSWYNDEISRYRDHEWQLTSYSVGLSSAVVLFAKGADTKALIAPWAAALALGAFLAVLIVAEFHTHMRLNEYRRRRSLLLGGKNHRTEKIEGGVIEGWLDGLYFVGFLFLPALFGLAAARVLLG